MSSDPEVFVPERYELREALARRFAMNRREFLAASGVGLLIAATVPSADGQGIAAEGTLAARLHLAEDGSITLLTGKVEEGQGPRTELAMAAAEELRVPLERLKVVMADTGLGPDDGITAGSRTTPGTVPAVRKAAAAARELLILVSSRQLNVARGSLEVRNGTVTAQGRSYGYADLAKSAELALAYREALPPDTRLTPAADWQLLGTPRNRLNGREIVTGSHRYPSDIVRPGMLYGAVLRAPSYGAKLRKLDLSPAKRMPGVRAVREGDFVGFVAQTSYAARKAVESVAAVAQWETAAQPSSAVLFEYLKEHAREGTPRERGSDRGSVEQGLKQAVRRLKASYTVAYVQHAPMEPRAAVAEWENGLLTVWAGTDNPYGVREQLARAFSMREEEVHVIVPDIGGSFGGKHTGEAAIEAARLAKEAGRPVWLRWTRSDEFRWAYFRPAALIEVEAGIDSANSIIAWDFANYNSGASALDTPYRIANTRVRFIESQSPLRQGSYRCLAATANNFAREAFTDELAGAAGRDPLEFRLAHLDNERIKNVLTAAAERFRWSERRKERRPGVGIGLACGTEKNSVVAACVEVETDPKGEAPRLIEIVEAFECGAILNPTNLRSQVEGCIMMGLGPVLREEIRFRDGHITNGSFAQYRVPRFRDVPKVEVVLLDRRDLEPAGAGETPIIAIAPAMANAVFNATGKQVRSMPLHAAPN
jgi:CO/xanthine dehydrogenase Mo-binding subunit